MKCRESGCQQDAYARRLCKRCYGIFWRKNREELNAIESWVLEHDLLEARQAYANAVGLDARLRWRYAVLRAENALRKFKGDYVERSSFLD